MKKWALGGRKLWIFGSVFLFGVPAVALYGGGFRVGGYLGPLPASYYDDEPCFTTTIQSSQVGDIREVRVNPRGVLEDNNPNTYLRCSDFANENRIICHAGFPDGTIASCSDLAGPRSLPDIDDRVYLVFNTAAPVGTENCEVVIEKTYGEANPACRTGSPPGTGGSGGGSSTCNAQNAIATISHGQTATVPPNACVRLQVNTTWSSINPLIQAQPQENGVNTSYPVPFTASSCVGTSAGSLVNNWDEKYLVDGSNPSGNWNCDAFVKFQGTGSNVRFAFYH